MEFKNQILQSENETKRTQQCENIMFSTMYVAYIWWSKQTQVNFHHILNNISTTQFNILPKKKPYIGCEQSLRHDPWRPLEDSVEKRVTCPPTSCNYTKNQESQKWGMEGESEKSKKK